MRLINSSVEVLDDTDADVIINKIERCLRVCYKSEDKMKPDSAKRIIRSCIARGHESPLEHQNITYHVVCDRGVSHEWVRHRIASYSQESTRYCNYGSNKFSNEITFIKPWWADNVPQLGQGTLLAELNESQIMLYTRYKLFVDSCAAVEQSYLNLLQQNATPEAARAVLSNAVKTEFYCTMNLRELRNFFKLRTNLAAHPDIRRLAIQLHDILYDKGLGIFFEDIFGGDK